MTVNEGTWIAALAGLLHDIGKFGQRAGLYSGRHTEIGVRLLEEGGSLGHLVPVAWQDDVGDAVAYHHGGDTHKAITQAVRVADWLAASERHVAPQEKRRPAEAPLIPITACLSLDGRPEKRDWGYPLGEKAVSGAVLFPRSRPKSGEGARVSSGEYARAWKGFERRVGAFPGPVGSFARMAGLLDLLADTTMYIPSATPWEKEEEERTTPDVPLYNHLHLTAAIAVCLMHLLPDVLSELHAAGWKQVADHDTTVAHLLKIDFSGIQAFIYRITEPTDERGFRHTAKRLRGRSLYLALLNRAVANWLVQRLDLPPTNVLYAGGGVIELLLPPGGLVQAQLSDALRDLGDGMWDTFHGDLGFVHATTPMQPRDFANVQRTRTRLEQELAIAKRRKWHERLEREDFFSHEKIYHTCPVCEITPVKRICDLCDRHKQIGQRLPYTVALAHALERPPQGDISIALPGALEGYLTLVSAEEQRALLRWAEQNQQPLLLQGVNEMPQDVETWPAGSAPGRWSVANAAPIVEEQVYDFEKIAALSRGAQLLGVLRADVDRMGLHFSHGLHPPTFSRTAALSETVARFFGPYLNEFASKLTTEWHEALGDDDELRRTLKERKIASRDLQSLFYVLYAGGDDLFVVGPWDQMVTFALRLAEDFEAYTCGNLSLSAGLIFVKPHFPVQHFTRLVGEAEQAAKSAGRNRIHFFNRTLPWEQAAKLIAIAREWVKKDLPRGLIHDLGRMGRVYVTTQEGEKPLFSPRLYYTLTRRLHGWERSAVQRMVEQVYEVLPDIVVPVSYVSLSTRKE